MSAPLPFALRARFQQYIEEGFSGRAAALCLKLSPATGARWAFAIKVMGHAQPAPQGRPKGNGKLAPHRAFFEELIGQDADIVFGHRVEGSETEAAEVVGPDVRDPTLRTSNQRTVFVSDVGRRRTR